MLKEVVYALVNSPVQEKYIREHFFGVIFSSTGFLTVFRLHKRDFITEKQMRGILCNTVNVFQIPLPIYATPI